MNRIDDLKTLCQMFYQDTNIPFYLYQHTELLFAFPDTQLACVYPPARYRDALFENAEAISYLFTDYGILYASVHASTPPGLWILAGPVNHIPFTDSDFHHMYADYIVAQEDRAFFQGFFQFIPPVSLTSFLTKMLLVNYIVNHKKLELSDILKPDSGEISAQHVEKTYEQKETFTHNNSYEVESLILHYIETGNIDGLKNMTFTDAVIQAGVVAPTQLRQIKNTLIVMTTLATRSAIKSGVDTDTAFQISDLYIRTAEQTNDPATLNALSFQMLLDFAGKVQECFLPGTSDELLLRALRFVQQNTNRPITVSDVAEYVGFSRSYFSTYFKEQMGFSLSAYILRCRLEESRQLLQFTDKPLSVISSYLCFSSQSHFQTAFKKQYKITPLQYRKNPAPHGKGLLPEER